MNTVDSSDIAVRTAAERDAASISRLSSAIGYPNVEDELRPVLLRLLSDKSQLVLVAELTGSVVGWLHAAEQLILESGPRVEILGLAVEPEARRLGVGSQLVHAAESWARKRGVERIGVRSNTTRMESHPFYLRLGYAQVKTQHVYRKSLISDWGHDLDS